MSGFTRIAKKQVKLRKLHVQDVILGSLTLNFFVLFSRDPIRNFFFGVITDN